MTQTLLGILNVNKPTGLTSRQVVNRVYRCVKPVKAGHAGTLDPLADGVLLVPIGRASRLTDYLHQLPKYYEATFVFGCSSESDDSETPVTRHPDLPRPSLDALQRALSPLQNDPMQRPPAYSAIKVDGRRSYDRARQGHAFELPARPVMIHSLEILDYDFPNLRLRIVCASGTYVRSIGRDLALALGSRAIMTQLTRTQIGPFHVHDAVDPEQLESADIATALRPAADALAHLPQLQLSADELVEISHGRTLDASVVGRVIASDCNQLCWSAKDRSGTLGTEIAAISPDGQLAALLIPANGRLKPHRVFMPQH